MTAEVGPDPAATYLEVAAKHRETIEWVRNRIANAEPLSPIAGALVEIDDAMRAVITDDR